MRKTAEIPIEYKYVIDRAYFEINRKTKTLAFMLDKNLDNPEFLNSDLCKKLENDIVDAFINKWIIFTSILNTINVPDEAQIDMDIITTKYSATWIEE